MLQTQIPSDPVHFFTGFIPLQLLPWEGHNLIIIQFQTISSQIFQEIMYEVC